MWDIFSKFEELFSKWLEASVPGINEPCLPVECRKNCGACCIAPSISSPLPGMPDGKPAGIPCIHLQNDFSCGIYEKRPKVCRYFLAEEAVCGASREHALAILRLLDHESSV